MDLVSEHVGVEVRVLRQALTDKVGKNRGDRRRLTGLLRYRRPESVQESSVSATSTGDRQAYMGCSLGAGLEPLAASLRAPRSGMTSYSSSATVRLACCGAGFARSVGTSDTSPTMTSPAGPVPAMRPTSRPCSAARRRAFGEAGARRAGAPGGRQQFLVHRPARGGRQ